MKSTGIKKLISKTQHKTGIHVNVPFTEQVQFLLLDYLKNHRPDVRSEYIFINTVTNSAFTSAKKYSHRLFIKILRKQVSNGDTGNVVPIH